MDKTNVEMENAKKLPQDSENELLEAEVESQAEELPSAASGVDKANACENAASGTHKANASVNEVGNAKSVADDKVDEVNEQTAAQTNSGGVKEENFAGYGMAGGDAIGNVTGEEKPAEIVAEEKKDYEIGREDGNPVTNVSEEEKLRENTNVEKISCENEQLPTELSAMATPPREDDPAHGENEKMADVVHKNEKEIVKDELKEPGNEFESASTVTNGNANSSETAIPLIQGDPAEVENENIADVDEETETVKDRVNEPENDGNTKSNETTIPSNEGDPAQVEDEKMADVVHENEDETVHDKLKEPGNEIVYSSTVTDGNAKMSETVDDTSLPTKLESVTSNSLVKYSTTVAGDHSVETVKTFFSQSEVLMENRVKAEKEYSKVDLKK